MEQLIERCFENLDKKAEKLIGFMEKNLLSLDKNSVSPNYNPTLYKYNENGKVILSKTDVEQMTGLNYDEAVFLTALNECVYENFSLYSKGEKQRKADYKDRLPAVLLVSTLVAEQVARNLVNGRASKFDSDDVSNKIMLRLIDAEIAGADIHVTRDHEKFIKQTLESPFFVPVLNKSLSKLNCAVETFSQTTRTRQTANGKEKYMSIAITPKVLNLKK